MTHVTNCAEWRAFVLSIGGPDLGPDCYFYPCQESTGNLADSIGSSTLTASVAPTYQQPVKSTETI